VPPPVHTVFAVRSSIITTKAQRERVLKEIEYNIFGFPAPLVLCDFFTDSGTSAMTDLQWSAILRGDESYGRNHGYYALLDAFRDIFERGNHPEKLVQLLLAGETDPEVLILRLLKSHEGGFVNGGRFQLARPNFFIVPQGRCAETLLFSAMQSVINTKNQQNEGQSFLISNGFFDTTGAIATLNGFTLVPLLAPGLREPLLKSQATCQANSFKGNIDLPSLTSFLEKNGPKVAMIILTITNNLAAGQPVSMANIQETSKLSKKHAVPLFFDACRFAENAKFIQDFEPGFQTKTIPDIVAEMFSYVDGFTISLKKDGLANMGGALCFRDQGLFHSKFSSSTQDIGVSIKEQQILFYGNDSYGGMSGRDLLAATVGLFESVKEGYLRRRLEQTRTFAEKLSANGVPVLLPPGGHAIYLDMAAFFAGNERKPGDFASVGFTIELLRHYSIRAVEFGPFMWEWDKKSPAERSHIPDLVRFALPRNVFTEEHINYVVAAVTQLHKHKHLIPSVRITRGADLRLRHFQCDLQPVYPFSSQQ